MDLIDLMEKEERRVKPLLRFPTCGVDPQKAQQLTRLLDRKDWRGCNGLPAVWYDRYAERWYRFGPTFFDVEEVLVPAEYLGLPSE